ncbi:hypothetical protein EJ997_10225 [Flaviflexus ciconiae]|uniref:Portal protein n=1 Tax=Flaviflexus ciconiae TaxID=2496867 RepID=A0A3Q9G572_9ACTO|nr:hypothetical protein [Flaviflexus ciconiae]AZQ77659.1 hypothetical protein EJ997_10225 [Flaviflexus ciconiae]
MSEIGYAVPAAGSMGGWNTLTQADDEENLDLQFPQSTSVFKRMRREETQLQTVLKAVKLPILRSNWRLNADGVDPEVTTFVAQNLGLPVDGQTDGKRLRSRGRFSWLEHLRLALTSLDFGFAFFEQVYEARDDGRLWIRKLGYRPQATIAQINVAADGGLVSVEQGLDGGRNAKIPVNRLVAYVNEREGAAWSGTSVLRSSYKYWLLKDRLLRVQAMTVERNGLGIPVVTAPPRDDGPYGDDAQLVAREKQQIAEGQKIASGLRAGETAGASLPHGSDLKLLGVQGQLPDAAEPIKYYDEQMAKSALAHFLTLGTQTGSWALGTTFADFFTMSLQTVAKQIAETATAHIIEDLVDLNFGETVPAPSIVFDEIGSQTPPTAQALQSLVQTGVIRPDDALEEFMRNRFGLPAADTGTAREFKGTIMSPKEADHEQDL